MRTKCRAPTGWVVRTKSVVYTHTHTHTNSVRGSHLGRDWANDGLKACMWPVRFWFQRNTFWTFFLFSRPSLYSPFVFLVTLKVIQSFQMGSDAPWEGFAIDLNMRAFFFFFTVGSVCWVPGDPGCFKGDIQHVVIDDLRETSARRFTIFLEFGEGNHGTSVRLVFIFCLFVC